MLFLPALALCFTAQPVLQEPVPQPAIDAAIERGMDFLVGEQELDGSWRFECVPHGAGSTGLCLYTLIKGGAEKQHQAVLRGLGYLDSVTPRSTYEVTCMILAYGSWDSVRYATRIQELTDLLIKWNVGSWSYPEGEHDLSNTHFGALGLRHAQNEGATVPEDVWKSVGKVLERWQEDYGGFPYRPGGQATLSMTAAGVGIACMVREGLGRSKGPPGAASKSMDKVISRGLRWLGENDAVPHGEWKGNVNGPSWDYYYLYALQRVGALAPVDVIGDKNWYNGGAKWLIEKQAKDGSWSTIYGAKQSNSCFAILFLRRASAPTTGTAETRRYVFRTEDPEAEVQFIATGQNPLKVWIQSLHPLVFESWGWPEDQGRGLRILKVEYLLGEKVLATVQGDPSQPIQMAPFAAELVLDEPGTYALRTKVYLEPALGDSAEDSILLSPELEVDIDTGLQAWMKRYVSDCKANLARYTNPTVECSSKRDDGWKPDLVTDNKQGTGWLCNAEDPEPWISLEFKKAIAADTILLSHARLGPEKPGAAGKARRVRITINKRKPFEHDLEMLDLRKTVIELAKPERIRKLTIELLNREAGSELGKSAGFMEVELQMR